MIPKKANIQVNCTLKVNNIVSDSYKEFLEREGFSEKEIQNKIEELIRLNLWELVPENKINISFD